VRLNFPSPNLEDAMRLDVNSLTVETFATGLSEGTVITVPADTGPAGPNSLCYICYETGNTVPSCLGYQCGIDPETRFYPCTNQLTCNTCV
jgi:hypothetical protein